MVEVTAISSLNPNTMLQQIFLNFGVLLLSFLAINEAMKRTEM
jgi:hypothetical protein